ncbi:ATP-dependent Zn protease [Leptolyngbyaceae cyanobacterium CCMR0082]|uniref:ATP-dependent Zn protease n=1 Tax=Adonisia turfae CCMR0082 TaxID=2304604 RepID=A0A6M0S9L0_9CYAN|nr:ATP-dependent Zn protease [Adonisia turfae]MDV3352114.1 ATP-dependent Zn protease [Leptothoe sp. LEGE 181152]NEZ65100.1 ATP-dependent Zn protease [Adonisia turfae CCMR0082]
MSEITLNLIAVSVFSVTMLILLGPLLAISPEGLATVTATLLGLITIDQLGWQGRGGRLLVDWLSQRSPEYCDRIVRHEAGHFLTAYLLGIPIDAYTLTAWETLRSGVDGSGGVIFKTDGIDRAVENGKISQQEIDRYCTVWMAGIAAEEIAYGTAQGGRDDRLKLNVLWRQINRPLAEVPLKQRWSMLQAKNLIEKESDAYGALIDAMAERRPVNECCELIEQHLQSAEV